MKKLLTLALVLCFVQHSFSQCDRTQDSLILVSIHEATNASGWTYDKITYQTQDTFRASLNGTSPFPIPNAGNGWESSLPISEWHGIELNGEGCVTRLILQDNGLVDSLPPLSFPYLKELNLSGNKLDGSFPTLDQVPRLEILLASSNRIEGPFPELDKVPALILLSLSSNSIYGGGVLAGLPELDLPKLLMFNCTFNDLTGNLPDLDKCPNLRYFNASHNEFEGSFGKMENLDRLEYINCRNNKLSGSIPDLTLLKNLKSFNVLINELSGPVPPVDRMDSLETIDLRHNKLEGEIPDLSGHEILRSFQCSDNLLTGNLPQIHPNLQSFDASRNLLSGTIPSPPRGSQIYRYLVSENQLEGALSFVDTLIQLDQYFCDNNKLDGPLPDLTMTPEIRSLDLAHNQFNGNIPIHYAAVENLNWLKLNHNDLEGCFLQDHLPLCLIGSSDNAVNLTGNPKLPWQGDFYKFCRVESTLEAFCQVDGRPGLIDEDCNCVPTGEPYAPCRKRDSLTLVKIFAENGGEDWSYSTDEYSALNGDHLTPNLENHWNFDTFIDTWHGIETNARGCVNRIILPRHNLTGDINNFDFPQLEFLCLMGNKFEGTVSDTLFHSELIHLDILLNNISGSVPLMQFSPKLQYVNFSSNDFTGNLPTFNTIPDIQYLSIGSNQLIGDVPDLSDLKQLKYYSCGFNDLDGNIIGFGYLPHLEHFNCEYNELEGVLPDLDSLPALSGFFCFRNQLSGEIPDLENSTQLLRINCSQNKFEGNLPEFNSSVLQRVDLTRNNLTDTIPASLGLLPDLTQFEVNNNMLSGCIPEGFRSKCTQRIDFLGNLEMPWSGDFEAFCAATNQKKAPCVKNGRPGEMNNMCTCEIVNATNDRLNSQLEIYPNPTTGDLFMSIETSNIKSIMLYDSKGRLVTQQSFVPVLDLHHLDTGIYFLSLISEHGVVTHERIVKI